MWKRVFAVLGSVFILALCLLPCAASASIVEGEDSSVYVPVLPFDSLQCTAYDTGYNVSFGIPWSSLYLGQNEDTSNFVERQFVGTSQSFGASIGGNVIADLTNNTFSVERLYCTGAVQTLKFTARDFVLTSQQLASLRNSRIQCTASNASDVVVSYRMTGLIYDQATLKWRPYERTWTSAVYSGQFSVPMWPTSNAMPLLSALGFYVIDSYEIFIEAESGHFGQMDMYLTDLQYVDQADLYSISDLMQIVIYDVPDIVNPYPDVFYWIVEPVEQFFLIELMPNVTIGGVAITIFAIPLVILLLKFFAGG